MSKLIVVFLISFILLAGCMSKEEGKFQSQSQSTQATVGPATASQPTKTPNESSSEHAKKETSSQIPAMSIKPSIGGISLGDTASQVQTKMQKPSRIDHVYQHPYIEWDYDNGLMVIFHSQSITSNKTEGVWKIDITKSSKLRTDSNIGIGDSKDLIVNTFKNTEIKAVNSSSNYQTLNVSTPSYLYSFVLQDNKIVEIMLQENYQ